MAINGYRIRYKVGTVVRSSFHCCVVFGSSFAGAPGGRGGYRKSVPSIEEQFSCVGEDGPFLHSSGKDTHEQAT